MLPSPPKPLDQKPSSEGVLEPCQYSPLQVGRTINVRARHAVMGEEKPEAEDWLRENVENSICNDLSINVHNASTIGNTPDTVAGQYKAGYAGVG